MFTGDLTTEQGKQDYDNYIMNNVRNEINSYTKQTQTNSASTLSSQLGLATPTTTIPVGTISPYAGTSAPANWLLCDGSAVSTTTYAALFAVLSTTYNTGGEPANTFRVPDLRGRVVAGKDNMGGTAANRLTAAGSGITGTTLGNAGGTQTHALTEAQLASHTHIQNPHGHPFNNYASYYYDNYNDNTANVTYGLDRYGVLTYITNITSVTPTNQTTGSGTAHQNTQPTIITSYIIKAVADVSNTFAVALGGDAGGGLTGSYPNPDVVYGHKICTSGARPSPLPGMMAYETDTQKIILYNGTSWITIPTADDEAYGQYLYDGAGLVAGVGNTKVPFNNLLFSKNLTQSSGSMIFAKTGVYEFSVGHRFGAGADTWTGVNLFNASTSTVLAKAYGTGQVGGADPGPVSYQFLGQITSTTQSHDIRIYRNGGALTLLDPDDNAGYQITCTVKRLST